MSTRRRVDVVIVGGRCAGAATALLLARRGVRVLVVERHRYGSDTLSTQAIMRGGVLQLARWGVLDALRACGTPTIRSTSFHYGDEVVDLAIQPGDGVDGLYAPRRYLLDKILVDAAIDSGAVVQHGARVVDLVRAPSGRVTGVVIEDRRRFRETVDCDVVIGADGIHSTVARLVGAEPLHSGRHATGVVYGYFSGLDTPEENHWYFRPGTSAGSIPTNERKILVFGAVPAERFMSETRFDLERGHASILDACAPKLAEEVRGAERSGPLRGFAGHAGFFRRSIGPGWALVGDASYFKDPITAHGMTDALRDAEILARAVSAGTERALADYHVEREALSLPLFQITDEVASLDWSLEAVKRLHVAMSREMKREVAYLLELDRKRPVVPSSAPALTWA